MYCTTPTIPVDVLRLTRTTSRIRCSACLSLSPQISVRVAGDTDGSIAKEDGRGHRAHESRLDKEIELRNASDLHSSMAPWPLRQRQISPNHIALLDRWLWFPLHWSTRSVADLCTKRIRLETCHMCPRPSVRAFDVISGPVSRSHPRSADICVQLHSSMSLQCD